MIDGFCLNLAALCKLLIFVVFVNHIIRPTSKGKICTVRWNMSADLLGN